MKLLSLSKLAHFVGNALRNTKIRRVLLAISFTVIAVLVLSFLFPRAPILSAISGWDSGKMCR